MRSLKEKVLVELKRGLAVSLGKEKEQQWGKRKPGECEVTEPREEKVSKRVCLVASYAVSIKWEKDREDSFGNAETVGDFDKRSFSIGVEMDIWLESGEELIESDKEHWHCVQRV